MATEHKVDFKISAEDRATEVFRRVQGEMGKFDRALSVLRFSWAAVGAAAIGAGVAMTKSANEAEQASNRLNAVLRATGHSAGVTRAEIDNLADSMHESTQFDDDAVRSAAAELLKFGNISREVFQGSMKIVADYAAFSGRTLPEAAQVIGKALASPVEGMAALERQIGSLHPAEAKLIKDLVESGRLLEAQGRVLDILKGKFGDTADIMNTGYLKATSGVTKAWGELLESFGKSGPASGIVQTALGLVEDKLKQIQAVVDAPWSEKFFKIMGMAAGVTPGGAAKAQASPADKLKAAQGESAAREKDAAQVLAEQTDRVNKFIADKREKAGKENAEREKRLREEDKKGWVAHADAVFDEAFDTAKALADIQGEHWKREERLREEDRKGWVAHADAVFDEAFDTAKALADIQDTANKKTSKAAQELGLTFSSAFEDAIVGGNKLREVLAGLSQDLLRIAVRKSVTEPIAGAASSFFSGIFSGMFGGGGGGEIHAATGAQFMVGGSGGTDSQHIRMALTPGERVTVETPSQQRAGGGPVFNIDNRGADAAAVARLERLVRELNGTFNQRAVAAVADSNLRGMRV